MTAANRLLRRLGKRRNLLRLPRFVEHDGRQPKEDFVLHPVADDIVVALFSRHSSFWHVRPGADVVALDGLFADLPVSKPEGLAVRSKETGMIGKEPLDKFGALPDLA